MDDDFRTSGKAAGLLLPFLRVKPDRAQCLIDLHHWKCRVEARRASWWFAQENPEWPKMELITTTEAAKMMGYKSEQLVSQALANHTLIATRRGPSGHQQIPRIPKRLVEIVIHLRGRGVRLVSPPQLIAKYEAIYQRLKIMNTLGVNGTCVNHRTGHHAMAEV